MFLADPANGEDKCIPVPTIVCEENFDRWTVSMGDAAVPPRPERNRTQAWRRRVDANGLPGAVSPEPAVRPDTRANDPPEGKCGIA